MFPRDCIVRFRLCDLVFFLQSEEKEKSDALQEDSKMMEKAANKRSLFIKKVNYFCALYNELDC